ncbi:MAG: S8 family serine peptidase [Caldilineaceae bacterium]|nr:S8 family serine peptidase [Caldilineaceae bacterium]
MVRTQIRRIRRLALAWVWAIAFCLLALGWAVAARPAQPGAPEPVSIFVQLADEPTAQVYAAALELRANAAQAMAQAQAHLLRVENSQTALLSAAPFATAQLLYRTQRVYNGLALRVNPAQLPQIAALPGVLAIHPLPVHTVETLRSVPFLGAPGLWDQVYPGGLTGETVSIGIIDTGIDYFHRDFGGPGTGFASNNPTIISDTVAGISFPTARVVGGYDFAGDTYSVLPGGDPIPRPDPDPVDCWGHGTHVAGIAGGSGLLRAGTVAYTGPYTSGLAFSQFSIGPGVAPRAELYALKVFGCTGASSLVPLALEWSVDPNGDGDFSDHLDVVNLSVGSSYGSVDDPSSVAATNAALAGVIVVAAGGNSGDAYYVVNSPSVADRAISVAATSISGLAAAEGDSTPDAAIDTLAGFSARGPRRGDAGLKPEIAAPGVSISSAAQGTGVGAATYSGTSMATPFVAGAAALLRQLHPGWTVEEIKALLLNTARYNVTVNDSQPPLLYGAGRAGAGRMDIEAARRSQMLFYNATNPGQVALSYGAPAILGELSILKNVRLVNKSPVTQTVWLDYLPVVDMPGVDIQVLGGPDVRLLPYNSLNVGVLFSAQADRMAYAGDPTVARKVVFPRHWLSEETGYLYVWPMEAPVQAELSGANLLPPLAAGSSALLEALYFPQSGQLAYTLTLTASAPVTVTSANLHLGQFHVNGPLLQPLDISTLSGSAHLSATGQVTLTAESAALLAAGSVYLQIGTETNPDGELRGVLTPITPVLRLPVYAAPRPVSSMRSSQALLDFGPAVSATHAIQLVGQGLLSAPTLQAAAFPTDTVSVVAALELQYSSPNEESSSGLLEHGDLKYVGVGSDVGAAGSLAQSKILFGLATYGDWSSPNEVIFRIHIDVNQDGKTDLILRSGNVTEFNSSASRDEFFSVLEEATSSAKKLGYFRNLVSSAELNTAVFNNSAVLLAVDAADIGLTDLHSSFTYSITTHSVDTDDPEEIIDRSRLLFYDVLAPGIRVENGLSDLPLFYDLPSTSIRIQADRAGMNRNQSRGVLLLHLHNDAPERTEEVEVRFHWRVYMPQVGSGE